MSRLWMLAKIMLKNQEVSPSTSKRDTRAYTVFGGMALLFIMIPCCIIVGFIAFIMTQALIEAGGRQEGILFIVQFMSACSVIFGLNVIINIFYFSKDIDYLLPLPLKMSEIVGAKFFVAYLSESVMEFLILASGFVGFILASGIKIVSVISAIVGMITIPIVPLVYCGLIGIFIMYITNGIKNRSVLHKMIGGLTLVFTVGLVLSFGGLKGLNVANYVENLASGQNVFLKIMNVIFFHSYILVKAVNENNILWLVLYIMINVVAIGLFLFMAEKFYAKGLFKMKSAANLLIKSQDRDIEKKSKIASVEFAYFKKECKILFRNHAFLMNCIGINILWPVAAIAVWLFEKTNSTFNHIIVLYQQGRVLSDVMLIVGVLALSVFITAANSIASSAFTREGAHFEFMKYVPISYKKQIHIKAMVSMFFSLGSVWLTLIVIISILKISPLLILYFFFMSFTGVFFITYLGIVLDSIQPKLIWDDEINALRGNVNVFFNMAFAIFAIVFFSGLGIGLYLIIEFGTVQIYLIYFLMMIVLDVGIYRIGTIKTTSNLKKLLN